MKTLTSVLFALALVSPVALSAAAFEGTVKMKMSGPGGKSIPLTYSLKSGLSRIEMQAGEGQTMATIVDVAKQQATMLMPEQKMYMVHSFAGMGQQVESANDVSFEKTNDHEKILGYDTTKYIAKSKDSTTEIWATEELGSFGGMSGGNPMGGRGGPKGQAWESVLRGKDMFPLRVVSIDKASKETFRMEATEVKKESLPDSLFVPPADYQKFDMGGMMRGLGIPGMPKPRG